MFKFSGRDLTLKKQFAVIQCWVGFQYDIISGQCWFVMGPNLWPNAYSLVEEVWFKFPRTKLEQLFQFSPNYNDDEKIKFRIPGNVHRFFSSSLHLNHLVGKFYLKESIPIFWCKYQVILFWFTGPGNNINLTFV